MFYFLIIKRINVFSKKLKLFSYLYFNYFISINLIYYCRYLNNRTPEEDR